MSEITSTPALDVVSRRVAAGRAKRAMQPLKEGKPFRVWCTTPFFSGSWDMETREAAVAYLADQLRRAKGLHTYHPSVWASGRNIENLDVAGCFVQSADGCEDLVQIGLIELAGPPAPATETKCEPAKPTYVQTIEHCTIRQLDARLDALREAVRAKYGRITEQMS